MAEKQGLIFMGSSAFSAVVLQKLLAARQNILAVYTQPDRKAGRGLKQKESAVKALAKASGIPVRQPANFRAPEEVEELAALKPDFLVVASYGLLLPESVLAAPKIAPLNIHPSLLPFYRGAAPIQRAIQDSWKGMDETGVAIMRLVQALDAGPVYASKRVPIARSSYADLSDRLAHVGSELLLETLPRIEAGLIPAAQEESLATYAAKLVKADGKIDWHKSSGEIDALIRAVNPWPGAQTELEIDGRKIPVLIRAARPVARAADSAPGQIRANKSGLAIACNDHWLEIDRIQAEGKKEVSGRDFVNGLRLTEIKSGVAS